MTTTVHILSGGAAAGLVATLEPRYVADTGCLLAGRYSAVGVMRDELLAGATCDVLILTQALITELEASGHVLPGSARGLGRVRTGVAVCDTDADVSIADAAALRQTLLEADGIHFPDPQKATAGIHFMKVLRALGVDAVCADRLHTYPNGATAMRAMAASGRAGALGCTQITEILYTPGVRLVGPLPAEFELATTYVAAVAARSESPNAAAALVDLLSAPPQAAVRAAAGFEA